MLDVRSANLVSLAAGLLTAADRTDMRYQWIMRLLGNPLVITDTRVAVARDFAYGTRAIFLEDVFLTARRASTHIGIT
jgi:hypothetical protein